MKMDLEQVLKTLERNDALARAHLQETVLWRGQRRSAEIETRLGSICFGDRHTASFYAESLNDRTFTEHADQISPVVYPAILVPRKIFAPDPPGSGDPFIDIHVVEALFGRDVARMFVRDLSSCMESTNTWEEISEETGHTDVLSAFDAGARMPPALSHEAYRLGWFIDLLHEDGYEAALTGGSGMNALEDEWHAFIPSVVRIGFSEVSQARSRAQACRRAVTALSAAPDVPDPDVIAPDLEFFEVLPEDVSCYRAAVIPSLSVIRDKGHFGQILPGEDAISAGERWSSVVTWMSSRGGALQALHESPIIATLDAGGFDLIDGWHRCVVAREIFGIDDVPVVVAVKSWPEIPDMAPRDDLCLQ